MSYIKRRIEKNRLEDEGYRVVYDQEVELLARERERREGLMKHLAAVRKARHFTQHAMAEAMNISQARVSQLERGSEPLSIDSFLQMLEVLNVRVVILTDDEMKAHGLDQAHGHQIGSNHLTGPVQPSLMATAESKAPYKSVAKSRKKGASRRKPAKVD